MTLEIKKVLRAIDKAENEQELQRIMEEFSSNVRKETILDLVGMSYDEAEFISYRAMQYEISDVYAAACDAWDKLHGIRRRK